MSFWNAHSHERTEVLPAILRVPQGTLHNPRPEDYRDAGWYPIQPAPVPEGHHVFSRSYEVIDGVAVESVQTEPIPPPPPPVPENFPHGIAAGDRIIAERDIETTEPDHGVILSDESGNKWLLAIAAGAPIAIQISASPEISLDERRALIAARRTAQKAARDRAVADRDGQLQRRIENLERLYGIRE